MNRALVAYGLGNFVFYAFRELTSQTGVLEVTVTGRRIDGYRWVPARISGGIPYSVDGRRAVAGARELARAPRVHGPPALTPGGATQPAEFRRRVAYRSRTGPVLPSPRATRSRSLRRARRRLPRRRDGGGRARPASRDLRRGLGARVDLVHPRRPGPAPAGPEGAPRPPGVPTARAAELHVSGRDASVGARGRAGLRALARPGADRQRRLQRVVRRLPAGDRPDHARRARPGRRRRRLGDASGDAKHLPRDERRDQGGGEALAAAPRRRLERLLERQAVVRGRRLAPHLHGRDGARHIPAAIRLEGRSRARATH